MTPSEHAKQRGREREGPSRGVSRYIEHRARLERQLVQWEAEMEEVCVAPTDKVRTLLSFAYDELRREDRSVTEGVVMRVAEPVPTSPNPESQ